MSLRYLRLVLLCLLTASVTLALAQSFRIQPLLFRLRTSAGARRVRIQRAPGAPRGSFRFYAVPLRAFRLHIIGPAYLHHFRPVARLRADRTVTKSFILKTDHTLVGITDDKPSGGGGTVTYPVEPTPVWTSNQPILRVPPSTSIKLLFEGTPPAPGTPVYAIVQPWNSFCQQVTPVMGINNNVIPLTYSQSTGLLSGTVTFNGHQSGAYTIWIGVATQTSGVYNQYGGSSGNFVKVSF